MDWMDNPLANMYGPHFLLFYAVVIVVTLVVCSRLLRRRVDSLPPTGTASLPRVGSDLSLYDEVVSACWRIKIGGGLIIGGLGGYKLFIALSRGRYNVLFLILMGIGALWVLFTMCPMANQKSAR